MAPATGVEPVSGGLTDRSSAIKLHRINQLIYQPRGGGGIRTTRSLGYEPSEDNRAPLLRSSPTGSRTLFRDLKGRDLTHRRWDRTPCEDRTRFSRVRVW
jgi:hypothetical protein